jgi:hypothetical protein
MPSPSNETTNGLRVALRLPADDTQLHTHCSASWGVIKQDLAHFPAPSPPGSEIEKDLDELGNTLLKAEGGDPAAIAAARAAAAKVRSDFELLGKYAQNALRAVPIADARAILTAVLMYPSNVGKRPPKPPLEARNGEASGTALLIALAIADALVYHWEWSLDQVSWSAAPPTGRSRGAVAGLTPGKVHYFRFRVFKRDDSMSEPSHAVSLMIK